MKFKLEFNCDNAAFERDVVHETTCTLSRLVGSISLDGQWGSGFVRDTNGNTIGTWTFVEEPVPAEEPFTDEEIAYAKYVQACLDENLSHHSWTMWIVHGRPTGPI